MSVLAATLLHDVRMQSRAKLYAIGVSMAVVMGLMARFLFDLESAGRLLVAFYLLGLGGTTYMFGAAMVLLEKSEGTLQALQVTPLTSRRYIVSKTLTLTAFAVLESGIVYGIGFLGVPGNVAVLFAGVALMGILYTLLGLAQVAPHDAVTTFLVPGAMVVAVTLQLPVYYLLDVGPPLLWYLIPTQGPLLIMLAAFEPLEAWQWAYALAMTAGSIATAGWWTRRRFRRFIGLQES